MDVKTPTLSLQNRDVLATYLAPLPAEARQKALDELQAGYESAVAPTPPSPGESAPEVDLVDQRGKPFKLSQLARVSVLSFYRGGWCNYCATALRALQRREPAISTFGGVIVGISPESSEDARVTARANQLRFSLLHDAQNKTADEFGLRWSIAPLLAPIYATYGVAPPDGTEALDVPYPATFVIDADGIVRATFMDRDPSKRMEPQDIARVVREINDRPEPQRG